MNEIWIPKTAGYFRNPDEVDTISGADAQGNARCAMEPGVQPFTFLELAWAFGLAWAVWLAWALW